MTVMQAMIVIAGLNVGLAVGNVILFVLNQITLRQVRDAESALWKASAEQALNAPWKPPPPDQKVPTVAMVNARWGRH